MTAHLRIEQVDPANLQKVWPFVLGTQKPRTGLLRIIAKNHPDFNEYDVYWWLRQGFAQLYLVSRGQRALGYFIGYIQKRPFSQTPEFFLWCGYSIPIRERHPDDDVAGAVRESIEYMQQLGKAAGAGEDGVVFTSNRKGFAKFGFEPQFTVWRRGG